MKPTTKRLIERIRSGSLAQLRSLPAVQYCRLLRARALCGARRLYGRQQAIRLYYHAKED